MITFYNGKQINSIYVQGKHVDKLYTSGRLIYLRPRVDRVLTNILSNGSFETNTTSWTGSGTLSRIAIATPIHEEGGSWCGQNDNSKINSDHYMQLSSGLSIISGNKYYIRALTRFSTSGYGNICTFMNSGTTLSGLSGVTMTVNTWTLLDGIWAANSASLQLRLNFSGGNGNTQRTGQIDNIMVIDLTSTFGAGQEPTIEELRDIIVNEGGYWDGEKIIGF